MDRLDTSYKFLPPTVTASASRLQSLAVADGAGFFRHVFFIGGFHGFTACFLIAALQDGITPSNVVEYVPLPLGVS